MFEKDKLLFAFLLCSRILESRGEIDPDDWMFLLTGGLGGTGDRHNPAAEWLSDRGWKELCRLEKLPGFTGLCTSIDTDPGAWRPLYDSVEPHRVGGCMIVWIGAEDSNGGWRLDRMNGI